MSYSRLASSVQVSVASSLLPKKVSKTFIQEELTASFVASMASLKLFACWAALKERSAMLSYAPESSSMASDAVIPFSCVRSYTSSVIWAYLLNAFSMTALVAHLSERVLRNVPASTSVPAEVLPCASSVPSSLPASIRFSTRALLLVFAMPRLFQSCRFRKPVL